ncbi:(d)CMP kinase [Robiginitalea aurantiaca]|uniref:Cytidylate kinase n=1 Tax=Robiginitalea aurantiaca TaxID=3056915 RepID=A0ABT7WHP8_9FLAO|nr:(d)CMP kinase [Robiginitalea aurantiaca]MDM9632444.1 (d)CMP kinase [Robiginitalea aurantiaca]
MRKISIAIDGHSSTGKSTLARQLAESLGYVYIDSGAMYRAVALFALRNDLIDGSVNEAGLIEALRDMDVSFGLNSQTGRTEIHLNGENVEQEIRTIEVSSYVSEVAAIPEVREKLVKLQREMGRQKGVVMDGRDIGTVVLPEAELKLFMTAAPETRAARRYKELLDRGEDITYEEVLKNVRHRDHLDSNRAVSPLKQAEDAICLDNSDMGLKEQFERVRSFANRILNAKK